MASRTEKFSLLFKEKIDVTRHGRDDNSQRQQDFHDLLRSTDSSLATFFFLSRHFPPSSDDMISSSCRIYFCCAPRERDRSFGEIVGPGAAILIRLPVFFLRRSRSLRDWDVQTQSRKEGGRKEGFSDIEKKQREDAGFAIEGAYKTALSRRRRRILLGRASRETGKSAKTEICVVAPRVCCC